MSWQNKQIQEMRKLLDSLDQQQAKKPQKPKKVSNKDLLKQKVQEKWARKQTS